VAGRGRFGEVVILGKNRKEKKKRKGERVRGWAAGGGVFWGGGLRFGGRLRAFLEVLCFQSKRGEELCDCGWRD